MCTLLHILSVDELHVGTAIHRDIVQTSAQRCCTFVREASHGVARDDQVGVVLGEITVGDFLDQLAVLDTSAPLIHNNFKVLP